MRQYTMGGGGREGGGCGVPQDVMNYYLIAQLLYIITVIIYCVYAYNTLVELYRNPHK